MVPIIKTENLSCKMGQSYLLKDINWEVMPGENWVVYGLNGSGKTTLLSIVAGYKTHSEGNLQVFGESYADTNVLRIRKRIGWVSGSFYDKHYTKESVLDIILSGKFGTLGLNYGVTLDDVKFARELTAELGIEDKLYHSFDMLSKGQRQNVMIARALFSQPEILVLDEPCNGLDVYNRSLLFSSIRKLSKQNNLTIIYVTHYTEEIIEIFDHTLLLKQGRVFAQGATEELFVKETLARFFGYPVEITDDGEGMKKLLVEADSDIARLLKEGRPC